jgi:hypothetical protein
VNSIFTAMKKVIIAALLLISLASCEFNIIEPRYDYRDRVTGYYDVEEYSETYNDYHYYSIDVTKYSSGHTVYLNNFYDADLSVYAYLDGDKLTIPLQVVDGYEIEGVGTLHSSDMSLNYRVKDLYNDTRTDFCETWGEREY